MLLSPEAQLPLSPCLLTVSSWTSPNLWSAGPRSVLSRRSSSIRRADRRFVSQLPLVSPLPHHAEAVSSEVTADGWSHWRCARMRTCRHFLCHADRAVRRRSHEPGRVNGSVRSVGIESRRLASAPHQTSDRLLDRASRRCNSFRHHGDRVGQRERQRRRRGRAIQAGWRESRRRGRVRACTRSRGTPRRRPTAVTRSRPWRATPPRTSRHREVSP